MRNNKFRGQNPLNDEWLYGSLTVVGEQQYIHDGTMNIVYPDTVGQYIGLKDKNGEEIYDNHSVELLRSDPKFNQGFHQSKAGEFMVKYDIEKMVLDLETCEYLSVKLYLKMIKNDQFLTEYDILDENLKLTCSEKDKEDLKKEIYKELDMDIQFLKYVSGKGLIQIVK